MAEASSGIYLSAPGKIILFGEHAVVYGKTALAGSIDLRTYISLFTSQDGRTYLCLPDLGIEKTWMLKDLQKATEKLGDVDAPDGFPPSMERIVPIARRLSDAHEDQSGVQNLAFLAFWYLLVSAAQFKRNLPAVKVTVRFKLPSYVGLGSSGAYCVCMAAALLQVVDLIPRPDIEVGDDGMTWCDPHLDIIRKCLPELKVILVNSKVERSTSRMVSTVKERLKRFPNVVEGIFDAIDAILIEAIKILNNCVVEHRRSCSEDEHHSLQELCRINNQLLIALGVGHPKVDQIWTTLARYGIHPKMTGAGGGGLVFAFLKPGTAGTSQTVIDMITSELTLMGYELWQPSLGGNGIVSHTKRPDILLTPKS